MNTVTEQKRVSIGKVIKKGGFKKAYHKTPYDMLAQVRIEICEICYWTKGNFRIKLAGSRPFRISEVKTLEAYFAAKGIDAWTGEPIQIK